MAIEVERTSSVAAVLAALTSDNPQSRIIKEGTTVVTGALKAGLSLIVTAEDGSTPWSYTLTLKDLVGNTAISEVKDADTENRILAIDNVLKAARGSSITLRYGTTTTYVTGKLTGDANNTDFVPTFIFENSDGAELAAGAVLSQGDQVKVTAPGYTTMYYFVNLAKRAIIQL